MYFVKTVITKNKTTSRNNAKYDKQRKILLVADVEQSACIKKNIKTHAYYEN